jgi:hypothetical protein
MPNRRQCRNQRRRLRRMTSRQVLFIALLLFGLLGSAQSAVDPGSLPTLLSQFRAETDRDAKERILLQITMNYPDAGPDLLAVAKGPENGDTNRMAIQGIGQLRFAGAVPFLEASLRSNSAFVRGDSAWALGEIRDRRAIRPLIAALSREQDSGVIEQTALALQMLQARNAIPVLKSKIGNQSYQTLILILGAVEALGGRAELPFIAAYLHDPNFGVREHAALSVERLSGQHFGFQPCMYRAYGGCGTGDESPIINAQRWWAKQRQEGIGG